MLEELRVENLLLLERTELRLAPGVNVLTGETGAGKTMLAQALDLLLGGRARAGIVRPGAEEAYVEGVFSLSPELDIESELLLDRLPAGTHELVLARRVWPDGRTRAYLCGRSATVAELRELGVRLITFYGQHEHRKLAISSAQLELLDRYCGADQVELRARVAACHARARAADERLAHLSEAAGARERELDLLAFELDEIEGVAPSEQEAEELATERDRLRSSERLQAAAMAAAYAIAPEAGEGALELLSAPLRELEAAAALDPALASLHGRLQGLVYETQELHRELRDYVLADDAQPGRLEEVEERLERFARLKRKHGGSITEVLGHAERCRERLAELEHADVSLREAERERDQARAELERLAAELSERRRTAAPELAAAVSSRLEQLALAGAGFTVDVSPRAEGIGARGGDTVEFRFSANPGLAAGPIRELASGGELSRLMLALMTAAEQHEHSSERQLLVFDEIDAGIGGHTARAVGEHLRALAQQRQILCITHLPQIASLADRHFRIDKRAVKDATVAQVSQLSGDAVVGELVRMLGASERDDAANEHARALLRAA